MNKIFHGPVAAELHAFLDFKRSLGYGYMRGEFSLREFESVFDGICSPESFVAA
jgi:hypothetical protein